MVVDELNLMLAGELATDVRQPIRVLAEKLGMKRTTVRDRLKRLADEGILDIRCLIDLEQKGYNFLIVMGITAYPGKAEVVANQLVSLPDIYGVHLAANHYGVLAWVLIQNQSDLGRFLSEDLATISHIRDIEMMYSFEWLRFSWGSPRFQKEPGRRYPKTDVNELDLSIIAAMKQDPRQTITKLAKKVGCSRATAKASLEKLINDEIIKLVAFIDRSKMGYDTSVAIFIKCEHNKIDTVAKTLSEENVATFVSKIIGQWHVYFSAEFRDSNHLNNFLSDTLASMPGVIEYEVIHLLKCLKYEFLATN